MQSAHLGVEVDEITDVYNDYTTFKNNQWNDPMTFREIYVG